MATQVNGNQLTDYWQDAATQTLPNYSKLISTGFAQDGNPVAGQKATLPGAEWFNLMAAVRVSIIIASGQTPSNPPDPVQFLRALQSLGWMNDKSVETEHLADKSVTTAKLADQVVTITQIANSLLATQSQAQTGTSNNVLMTPARVKEAILALLPKASSTQLGGVKITGDDGITIGSDGTIAVDFSKMPTDKFEDLVKSIRVPIWLTKNKNFYCNSTTGVDNTDEGRGESEGLPWKTLNYALRQITDNYNISIYDVYLFLAPGTYGDQSTASTSNGPELYSFQGTGQIYITGNSPEDAENTVIVNLISLASSSSYAFRNVTIKPIIKSTSGAGYNVVDIQKGTLNLYNVFFKLGEIEKYNGETQRSRQLFYASNYGFIRIYATNGDQPSGITIDYEGMDADFVTLSFSTGSMQMTADINIISSNANESNTFISCGALSSFKLTTSVFTNPGRAPQINVSEGVSIVGRRYVARENSIISTGGKGVEFFPGTIAGNVSTGGQYS